jgi:hypothetical protein
MAGDQELDCIYTYRGKDYYTNIKITVARPIFARYVTYEPVAKAQTASRVTIIVTYQLVDQFGNDLHTVYSFKDSYGNDHDVTVIKLYVSETFQYVTAKPPSPPEEAHDILVSTAGRFLDTHSWVTNATYTLYQFLTVSTLPFGKGDTMRVRTNTIKVEEVTISIWKGRSGRVPDDNDTGSLANGVVVSP